MFRSITLTAVAVMGLAGSASAQDLTPIRVGAGLSADSAPAFVAVANGIYEAHGLDAELVIEQTGVELVNGLMAQSTDVALLGSTPFLSGASKGMPLVLIGHLHGDASVDAYSAAFSVVAGNGVDVSGDPFSFKGHKIGVPRGSGAETYINGLLDQSDLTPDDVTLINLNPSDMPTALQQGDVDMVAIWEPWATTAALRVEGAKRVIQAGCKGCYDPGAILTVRATIQQKPDVLQRFMAATDEAMMWIRSHPQETAEINMQWIPGMEMDVMSEALTYPVRDTRVSMNTVKGYVDHAIPALAAAGRVDAGFDVKAAIDATFSNAIQSEHPEYYADLPALSDADKF